MIAKWWNCRSVKDRDQGWFQSLCTCFQKESRDAIVSGSAPSMPILVAFAPFSWRQVSCVWYSPWSPYSNRGLLVRIQFYLLLGYHKICTEVNISWDFSGLVQIRLIDNVPVWAQQKPLHSFTTVGGPDLNTLSLNDQCCIQNRKEIVWL